MDVSTVPRRWRFESNTDSESSRRILVVQALTTLEANRSDCNLKLQVEYLLRHAYILATGSPAKAACATADLFKMCNLQSSDSSSSCSSEKKSKKDQVMERKLLLFVYASDDNEDLELCPRRISGFARVYEDSEMNAVVASSFAIHGGASEEKEHEIVQALFRATQEVGEAFIQSVLLEYNQQPSNRDRRSSIPLWRGIFGASEYLKQYFRDQGFRGDSFDRLELTKFLDSVKFNTVKSEVVSFPEGITVKPLDFQQDNLVKVYDVLKMAFGGNPPSFNAWKIHYAQHPRFAPELSFVAWDRSNEPVSVVLVERIVEGEGGGDDEVDRVYATQYELAKAKKTGKSEPDRRLVFSPDFHNRKSSIEATAREAYVCGVATKVSHRSKGIAANLLRMCFEAAEKSSVLEKVTLGTDRFNTSAVRAYLRAGMVETRSVNPGRLMAKDVRLHTP